MRRFAPLLLLAVFSCGGGDPFTPELPTPFDLTLTGPASGNGIIDAEGNRFCRFQLTAIATGGAEGTYALWTEGEIQWYHLGVAGSTWTTNWDQEEMVNYWGSDRVTSGSTRLSGGPGEARPR